MSNSEISQKARFDNIRYAQLWEDADVLLEALPSKKDMTLVSICSAGDNALSMLTLDPERIVVVDLSLAQIYCLNIRISAYRTLDHDAFLRLMGSRPATDRAQLLSEVTRSLSKDEQLFWDERKTDILSYGLGGIGKFERYFRIMRTWLLPLVHSRSTIDAVFDNRPEKDLRQKFYDLRWNNWRWKLLLKTFFSRYTMGRLGRDPAFFDHVEGSVADHVARRIVHAAVDLQPADNPYLHWILKGTHASALPHAWRVQNYDIIRNRLDRLDIRHGSLETFTETGERADGYNLSDIFEYMNMDVFTNVYGRILATAHPEARLVYWNMMAPRRRPDVFSHKVKRLEHVEATGKAADKAFFYSDFVVEEVLA